MLTPIKAIRAKCLDGCCGNMAEVNHCPAEKCALHPFRFGKNPHRAGIGNHSAKPPVAFVNPTHGNDSAETPTSEGKDTTPDTSAPEA